MIYKDAPAWTIFTIISCKLLVLSVLYEHSLCLWTLRIGGKLRAYVMQKNHHICPGSVLEIEERHVVRNFLCNSLQVLIA